MNPSNLNILYEDSHIIVCVKPHGIATQSRRIGSPDMVSILKNHIHRQNPEKSDPYLAVIHRLDQPVTGILVFAKTPFAAKELNRQLTAQGFGKYYRALVDGSLPADEGLLEDYLLRNPKTNLSSVCEKDTKDAKLARLHYRLVPDEHRFFETNTNQPELEIQLDTGRHHQIRVQLSHMGCPISGDTKYNPVCTGQKKWQKICLCAYKLNFIHPKTKKNMHFELNRH